ncbi:MAG: inositol monophosphatase family protein [Bacillota bacterium]
MIETAKIIETAKEAVISAGRIIKDRLGSTFCTEFKSCPADLVTEVDRQSQEVILNCLRKAYPDHIFIAEEDFKGESITLDNRPVWFIDPLDGTTNFVFGIPLCAVTAALTVSGKPVAGVTYDPFREELYTAARGMGAFRNDFRINVDISRSRVEQSLIATGFPSSDSFKDEMWKADFKKMFYNPLNLRAFGSAALELAYIASGRLTGYWEVMLKPWDVAAGILLVEEAGGKVSDLSGNTLKLGNYVSIVASNSLIHDEMINMLGFNNR